MAGNLYHHFISYFIYDDSAKEAASILFAARSQGTWKQYLTVAKMIFAQSNILEISFFPLETQKLQTVLLSVQPKRWKAATWIKVGAYLKMVAKMNGFELDKRIQLIIDGKARTNIVRIQPRPLRPVLSPQEFRVLLYRVKALGESFHQHRCLLAVCLSYYTVGRAFDLSFLQGQDIEIGVDVIRIHYHIKKNNKLGMKRCVGTIYPNGTYLCPVLVVLRALAFLKVGPLDYLFHKVGDKSSQILPSTLVGSIKNVQRTAHFSPLVTITDIRASAVSALARAQVDATAIQVWGGWETSQLKSYARSDNNFRKALQNHLEA